MVQFSTRAPAIPTETYCGFNARVINIGFLVDRECQGQVFQFPLLVINPPMLCTGMCVKPDQSACYQNFDLTECSCETLPSNYLYMSYIQFGMQENCSLS